MEQVLLFTLLGLGAGALIAGLALSLVATYRGSGTVNLATGGIAMFSAYVYYGLNHGGYLLAPIFVIAGGATIPTIPATLITLAVSVAFGFGLHFLVLRPLRLQSALAKLVATVGVLLIVQAYVVLTFGSQGLAAPAVLPSSPVTLLGGVVPSDRLILVVIVVIATLGLAASYRYTRFGLATRAAQESETEAALSGLSASRLSLTNTLIASVLSGALGILVAPLTQLDPSTIALAVVPALGAALLARFNSFVVAGIAGIGMGVLASLVTVAQNQPWFPTAGGVPWPGVTDVLYFLVIVVALLWRGQSLPDRGTLVEPRLPRAPAPTRIVRPTIIAAVVGIAGMFLLPYDLRQALIISVIGAMACFSLVLLIGLTGQVSFFQYALAGVAGLIVSKMTSNLGVGWPWAPLVGIAAAIVIGLIVALPALRIRGVNLAILTLSAAVAVNSFGFGNPVWGASAAGAPVVQPSILGFSIGTDSRVKGIDGALPSPLFGVAAIIALVFVVLLFANIRRTTLGKQMLAVRSNERAAAAGGVSPVRVKLISFGIASGIMALAGVFYSYNFGLFDQGRFSIFNAVSLVAYAYIGGITTIRGAIIGGLAIAQGFFGYIINHYLGISTTFQLIVAGLLLVVTLITNPDGIALAPSPKWPQRLKRRFRPIPSDTLAAYPSAPGQEAAQK